MKAGTILRRIVVGSLLGLAVCCAAVQAQTVHLVTVGDFRSFKGDALVGIKKDIANITSFFNANVPNDRLKIVNVDGDMATPDAILKAVTGLSPDKNDTLVFYYSGHAANAADNGGQFLQLKDEKGKPTSLTRAEIRNALCGRNPRLVVLLTDCCNVFAPREDKDVQSNQNRAEAPLTEFTPVISELFIKPTGVVDLTSSKVGQYSYAAGNGSIATVAWIAVFNQINEALRKDPSVKKSWRDTIQEMVVTSDKIFKAKYPDGAPPSSQKTQVPHVYEYPGVPRFGVRVVTLEVGNVQVTEVVPQSPGATAGFKSGDIITSINGEEILDEPAYSRAVDKAPRQIKVVFKRDGKEQSVDVELYGLPVEVSPEPSSTAGSGNSNGNDNGSGNASLDPNVYGSPNQQSNSTSNGNASQPSGPVFGASVQGNKIVKIVEGSPAAAAGLAVNDRILKFNETVIATANDFSLAVDSSPAEAKLLVLKASGSQETVTVRLNRPVVFGASVQENKIVNIVENSPAANAGLEVDDLILTFNGTVIKQAEDFARAVDESGATASLRIRDHRTNAEKDVEVRLNK